MINYCAVITSPGGGGTTYRFSNTEVFVGGNRYEPRIDGQPQWAQWLFGLGKSYGGGDIPTVSLRLHNADGAFDSMIATASAFAGGTGYIFAVLEDGVTTVQCCSFILDPPTGDVNYITLTGREWIAIFDKPLSSHKYLGTNTGAPLAGIEGTAADIKGLNKPQLWGANFNVEPRCVNTSKLIYQFQDETYGLTAGYSVAVYDRRAVLTAAAVYVSQADMETNAPVAGQYRLWPAGGCIRLGSSPVGRVTCDVTNPADTNGVTGNQTTSDCQRIINKLMANAGFASGDEFHADLKQVTSGGLTANFLHQQAGIYITEPTTYLNELTQLAGSVGMGMFFRQSTPIPTSGSGPMLRRLYGQTSGASATLSISDDYVLPGSVRPGASADPEKGTPVIRFTVGYQPNSTVMSKSDAPAATDAVIASIGVDQLTITGAGSQAAVVPNNPEMKVPTLLYDATSANDMLVYLGGSGTPNIGTAYDMPNQSVALEIPESVFLTFLQAGAGAVFGPDYIVAMTYSRFSLSGINMQLLSYQATGRRTFALILRIRRG